ncbi:MAG: hypothetical protein R6U98_14190 [Pirellulaceae bacterium]
MDVSDRLPLLRPPRPACHGAGERSQQLGVPPVEVPHEEAEDADEPTEAAEGPRPRHCAVCKGEMDYVGGTHRPSARRVMEFIWDDIVLAVDVCPESCEVRTRVEVCRARIEAALAAARERESADEQSDTQEKSQGAPDPANPRRGPPPDPQGRLAFAVL